jgi:hypothetical protein
VDDSSDQPESELEDGMVVTLRGTIDSDGVSGTAEKVESEDELQGQVESVFPAADPAYLIVLSQNVYVDDLTYYGNVSDLSGLVNGDYVEVHGQRDANGNIWATRVEKLSGSPEIELKGIVSNLGATTFELWGLAVDFSSAVIEPSGATIAEGDLVEVEGTLSGDLLATKVELEKMTEDPDFDLPDGAEVEVEGYISGFSSHPGSFMVAGQEVQTFSTTEFENGSEGDLADSIKVEAEGTLSSDVLLVREISFKRTQIEMEGTVTTTTADSITLLGIEVAVTDLTEGTASVAQHIQVDAYVNDSGDVVAESIEDATGSAEDGLQAPVDAKSGDPSWTLTLLGLTADLSGTVQFEDDQDQNLTREAFFGAVEPASVDSRGTLVKLVGSFTAGELEVSEAELED